MGKSFNKVVGKRLREVRILTGHTVNQLAQLFDCSEDHYRRIERGVYTLSIEKLAKLYAWTGVDPLFLITGKRRWLETSSEREYAQNEPILIVKQLMSYCNAVTKDDSTIKPKRLKMEG